MSVVGSNVLAGASGQVSDAAYQIDRSLRFDSSSSSYLSRTPSSAGNRKTWTWSGWVKVSSLSSTSVLFGVSTSSDNSGWNVLRFVNGALRFSIWTTEYRISSALFRDFSAWCHIVAALDTTNATADDRLKLYVNGARITDFSSTSTISQNTDLLINSAVAHGIGVSSSTSQYLDAYLADVHFVDGQALAPTDFGEYDDNNNWNPKAYSGTYGTNGFHLDFADPADLGDDNSGNGNDWTPNNLVGSSAPVYSAYATNPSSFNGSAANLFDGDTSTAWQNTDTSGSTYASVDLTQGGQTSGVAFSTSFEMYGAFSYNQVLEIVHAGGTHTYTGNPGGSGAYVNFTSSLTSPVTTVRFKDSGGTGTPSWNAIRVDGTILEDSGPDNDSLIDTPTNYEADSGNNRGNYATLNPLVQKGSISFSEGNLTLTGAGSNSNGFTGVTINPQSGKYYFEFTTVMVSNTDGYFGAGVVGEYDLTVGNPAAGSYPSTFCGFYPRTEILSIVNGSETGASTTEPTTDYTIGLAFDFDAQTIILYLNGTQGNTVSFSSVDKPLLYVTWANQSNICHFNFGQRPFAYTPPTGYKSLCTQNLPDPTIADGSTAMDAVLYTGTASTNAITGLNFSPDWVWIKGRSAALWHNLFDTVRGNNKILYSNATNAEESEATASLTSFDSNGFTLSSNGSTGVGNTNGNGTTYVAWAWDAGTSTASNTDGSITSNVRANASAGFSIVSYTGVKTASTTIGHGLNAAPGLIILKDRDDANFNWQVYHEAFANTNSSISLNLTAAANTGLATVWNATAPTSTVFTVGTSDGTNKNNDDYIAYCFAPVEGYSAFGTYTGNGSSDGPFIFTGMRPKWIMTKVASGDTGHWWIYDSERDTYNLADSILNANLSNAEYTSNGMDILSNGFKIRSSNANTNGSGFTFLYAAFAEHPQKTARAR